MNRGGRAELTPPECALAAEMFDHFCSAGTMKQILALHREICNTLNLKPNRLPDFYPKLKAKLASSWKAQALFKKFDARANHKVYGKGRVCAANKVLIIGAGPCGLRAAIECQLLGAKVVAIEKRDRMSRNNVLHLWPFVIQDLRALGAKKFFGKFCAGSIDHISIRQLQCILLKVALLLGVEFHEGISFEELLEPSSADNSETLGWRARVLPSDHPVSLYEFDVLLGADGKRNTLHGFKRKEFRGKLAMAITANFINRHTEQEASVPEISGVAFIFNQKFFKELYEVTGIDLENIVYYKDDTHYFVMTAKKHSLLDKGVLSNDYAEVSRLLSVENVDRAALMRYAQEAARFSTDGRLPLRDFALNHYGEPDVALFDFTSMYAAENASMVYERLGRRLLCQLVGDSLLEPFWPTGSGCARGFLSALDAAWAVRTWGQNPTPHPLEVLAERESIYRLLAQTTPENLHRDFGAYTLDPGTRYPNLNRSKVSPHQATSFYDSDEPLPLDATPSARKRRREAEVSDEALVSWVGWTEPGLRAAVSPHALSALLRRYRPDLLPDSAPPRAVFHVLNLEFGIAPFSSGGTMRDVTDAKIRLYLARVYTAFKGEVPHVVHNQTGVFDQIKQNQQKEKHSRNTADHSLSMYSHAAETDKSHSSYRKKRRSVRPQVSHDEAEYIRKKIGKLDLNNITQLAKLIEGHDSVSSGDHHTDKQKELQDQIIALLDPEDAPDPEMLRNSISQVLQGTPKTKVKTEPTQEQYKVACFFQNSQKKPVRPPRRLKGLDAASIKVPDFSDFLNDFTDTDATLVDLDTTAVATVVDTPKKKEFGRSMSTECPNKEDDLGLSFTDLRKKFERSVSVDVPSQTRRRHSDIATTGRRSQSPERPKGLDKKEIAQLFERQLGRHTRSPEKRVARSGSVSTLELAVRKKRMADIFENRRKVSPSPDRSERMESIGTPEMQLRTKRMNEIIEGKHRNASSQERGKPKDTIGIPALALRKQKVVDLIQGQKCKSRTPDGRRPKTTGRRRAAREIMRQRYEKSVQMLASEPRLDFAPSADLENDYGLQQYRASAPEFGDRVKKLEKQIQHYEEGRIVGGGGRNAGGGARVARLAAELAGTTTNTTSQKSSNSKPKDLMRSVGKIERDDWNVKEIERKIMENRLGRPEPKTAEKVPKWDREQFLGRQKRLKEGDGGEEKWGEIDETLHKFDQKMRDSGRPDHGTKKVANLANKFVKKEEEPTKAQPKEELKKSWRGPPSAGMQCAACGARVFAAEGVTADGLHLHRACFRCAVCKAVLRPGNYTMERNGCRLVCLRHSGVNVPDTITGPLPPPTPERISIELSDSGAREIDEDEWTDRNFLASETSCAGGLSDEEESSSDEYTDADDSGDDAELSADPPAAPPPRHALYMSDDSFGYDDYSDDGAESSGNESCSRMRAAREARRREVPADARPPTDSSEVESEDSSSSSDESVSSATEVSTDSEFAREESAAPAPAPPAILVTEATPPAPPPPHDYPLSRTRSAGGLATKRALELKRKYLLGEPSPPAVRKSDSTSQLDTKLEAFRSNITEFQKMLHPAPSPSPQPKPIVAFQVTAEEKKAQPMPDIIKNLCADAPVDLLTKGDSPLCKKDWREETIAEEKKEPDDLESDSLSEDDSSHTETAPNQPVPRVQVHNEGGELIQLDSLLLATSSTEDTDEKASASGTGSATGPTVRAADTDSSESLRDAVTLVLTETELSDWAAESAVLDDCNLDERDDNKRGKNPRSLSGPKTIHDAKNITAISSHVCGRTSPPHSAPPPEPVHFSNALEHFEFVDEGEQDPSLETPATPPNTGYMELVDDFESYSPGNDRSMNFIEKSFSETMMISSPAEHEPAPAPVPTLVAVPPDTQPVLEPCTSESVLEAVDTESFIEELKSPQVLITNEKDTSESSSDSIRKNETVINDVEINSNSEDKFAEMQSETLMSEKSPPLVKEIMVTPTGAARMSMRLCTSMIDELISPPLSAPSPPSPPAPAPLAFAARPFAPAICRSASENFTRPAPATDDHAAAAVTTGKVQEIKREREEQTEVVRRLVLERLGSTPRVKRGTRGRARAAPAATPPPVPPPPALPPPPPVPPSPPRPAPPLMPMPVMPSLSDPELARGRRRYSIMKSISNYLNRRLGPRHKWYSEPDLSSHEPQHQSRINNAHKSTGALQDTPAPPVPPPPASYRPPDPRPTPASLPGTSGTSDVDERDAMQLWFEARWARLVAQRRARDEPSEPHARRVARLERRLTRPLSAEQQAATVAELVQVSAQRGAHQALLAADRRRSGVGDNVT